MDQKLFDGEFFRQLESLNIVSKKVVRGQIKGERRSPKRGTSVEFCDYRHYEVGDDFRYVDWNIYSRLDKLMLKLFVEEEDLCIHILIDSSSSMSYGTPRKIDYALKIAAALGYIGLVNFERVGVGFFSKDLVEWIVPRRGRDRFFSLLDFLSGISCQGETNLNLSLRNYALRAKRPGVAIIISDFLDREGYEGGIKALLKRKFEVFLLHIISAEELDPPLSGDLKLVDAEMGEIKEVTIDGEILKNYRSNLADFLKRLENFCLKNEIEYLRTTTSLPFRDLVLKHLRGRFVK